MKNSFFLVIPDQVKNPQLSASFEESALLQWISELPTANPALATRLFHELITDFNTVELAAAKRLAALELLRPYYLMIEEYLRSRLVKSGFPKGQNEQKIMSVLVSIERQFTISYWSIVRDLTRRDVGWLQGKNTALSIQRTIKGLSAIVVTHYMMSAPIPDWIWIDLHSLYKLSVKIDKNDAKITEQGNPASKISTIEDCYKQILLLSLANPSGLMQKEFQQVYTFVEKVNNLVDIRKTSVEEQSIQVVVLMDEDSAPFFLKENKNSDSAMVFLDLVKLYRAFKQPEKFCSKDEARFSSLDLLGNGGQKLSAELFDYLLQRWQGKELQGTPFFPDRLDRYVAIGLDVTHDLQSTTHQPDPADEALEVLAETNSERALSSYFEKEGVLSIGSLISLRKKDAPLHLRSLGVVTKITLPKQDKRLVYEINVIAIQSFSVSYATIDAQSDAELKKALLYATKDDDGEKSFIILDSFMFKDGDVLRMYMAQEDFPVVLRDRRNIGLGYWQFECRRLAEKMVPAPQKRKGYDFI